MADHKGKVPVSGTNQRIDASEKRLPERPETLKVGGALPNIQICHTLSKPRRKTSAGMKDKLVGRHSTAEDRSQRLEATVVDEEGTVANHLLRQLWQRPGSTCDHYWWHCWPPGAATIGVATTSAGATHGGCVTTATSEFCFTAMLNNRNTTIHNHRFLQSGSPLMSPSWRHGSACVCWWALCVFRHVTTTGERASCFFGHSLALSCPGTDRPIVNSCSTIFYHCDLLCTKLRALCDCIWQ